MPDERDYDAEGHARGRQAAIQDNDNERERQRDDCYDEGREYALAENIDDMDDRHFYAMGFCAGYREWMED